MHFAGSLLWAVSGELRGTILASPLQRDQSFASASPIELARCSSKERGWLAGLPHTRRPLGEKARRTSEIDTPQKGTSQTGSRCVLRPTRLLASLSSNAVATCRSLKNWRRRENFVEGVTAAYRNESEPTLSMRTPHVRPRTAGAARLKWVTPKWTTVLGTYFCTSSGTASCCKQAAASVTYACTPPHSEYGLCCGGRWRGSTATAWRV